MPPKVFIRKRKRVPMCGGPEEAAASLSTGDIAGIDPAGVNDGSGVGAMDLGEDKSVESAEVMGDAMVSCAFPTEVVEGIGDAALGTEEIGISDVVKGLETEVEGADEGIVTVEMAIDSVSIGPSGVEGVVASEGVSEAVGLGDVSGEGTVFLSLGGNAEVVKGMIPDVAGVSSQFDDLECAGVTPALAPSFAEVPEGVSAPVPVITEGVDAATVVEKGVPVIDSDGVVESLEQGSTSAAVAEGVEGGSEGVGEIVRGEEILLPLFPIASGNVADPEGEDEIDQALRACGFDLEAAPETDSMDFWGAGSLSVQDYETSLDRVIGGDVVTAGGQTEPPHDSGYSATADDRPESSLTMRGGAIPADDIEPGQATEFGAARGFLDAGLFAQTPVFIAVSILNHFTHFLIAFVLDIPVRG